MAVELKPNDWRRDDCDARCTRIPVILVGSLKRELLEIHPPEVHFAAGRAAAGELAAAAILEVGPLVLDRHTWRIWVGGQEISPSRTEWAVLLALVDGNGGLVTQADILVRVWGYEYRDEGHLLRVNLSRLRGKLGPAAGLIETVAGIGYRFRFVEPGVPVGPPILRNLTLTEQGKWSRLHSACVGCGTTKKPHYTAGRCSACHKARERARTRARRGTGAAS